MPLRIYINHSLELVGEEKKLTTEEDNGRLPVTYITRTHTHTHARILLCDMQAYRQQYDLNILQLLPAVSTLPS